MRVSRFAGPRSRLWPSCRRCGCLGDDGSGSKPGKQYSLTLLEKAVVGARSTCDCVLVDEPGVSPEQFELYQMDGHVFIRSLDTDNPTLVDGLPTESPHRIQSEALVGTRDFIVRIIFGEGRATARS